MQLSAVTPTVKDVREVIGDAERRLGEHGQGTILFLDEVHRFNKAQQDALLPAVESGLLVLIGATTENPYFEVNPPLLSRSTLFRLEPLSPERDLASCSDGARRARGRRATTTRSTHLAEHRQRRRPPRPRRARGGRRAGRRTATAPRASDAAAPRPSPSTMRWPPSARRRIGYGVDEHYDVVSAFIKCIRGSDVDAGLYWLAHMLEAGEDARFIARRLVILASEDVGMADSMALVVADAAARAVEFVGLPEAQLNLAHAVVYLATAPKSNRVYTALGAAAPTSATAPHPGVPAHLRGRGYRGAGELGHGAGYRYPHDDPRGWVEQQYRPDGVAEIVTTSRPRTGARRRLAQRWPAEPAAAAAPPGLARTTTAGERAGGRLVWMAAGAIERGHRAGRAQSHRDRRTADSERRRPAQHRHGSRRVGDAVDEPGWRRSERGRHRRLGGAALPTSPAGLSRSAGRPPAGDCTSRLRRVEPDAELPGLG